MVEGLRHFRSYIIKRGKIPQLPENEEELAKISLGGLKIIEYQEKKEFGTNVECAVKLECPFCHSQFTGWHEEGCFHSVTYPLDCPVCGYPSNILKKLQELREKAKGNK